VKDSVFNLVFGCNHRRTTFPMTPVRKKSTGWRDETLAETYVVCLECGKQFVYDWENMRLGRAVEIADGAPHYGSKVPFRTKSKRICSGARRCPLALVLGKVVQSRRRAPARAPPRWTMAKPATTKTPRPAPRGASHGTTGLAPAVATQIPAIWCRNDRVKRKAAWWWRLSRPTWRASLRGVFVGGVQPAPFQLIFPKPTTSAYQGGSENRALPRSGDAVPGAKRRLLDSQRPAG
jgi:hypothetical protein